MTTKKIIAGIVGEIEMLKLTKDANALYQARLRLLSALHNKAKG